jgi:hypothetical protein
MKGVRIMSANVIFFGWNHPYPGREQAGAELFQECMQYFGRLQQERTIQSFEVVLLNPHGGDLNGFFLIRGEGGKLDALESSEEWQTLFARAVLNLEGPGAIRGVADEQLRQRMNLWTRIISA